MNEALDNCAACGAARREHTTPGGTRYGPQSLCSIFIPPPSATGAAEPDDDDPPMKWLIDSLRSLARDLLADPKTPWIGERDPKQHICWTAADRLDHLNTRALHAETVLAEQDATPPVRGDREKIARLIYAAGSPSDPEYAWKEAQRIADIILSLPNQFPSDKSG